MDSIELRAYAKINLALEVLKKRDDGYHELRGVMHGVGIYDVITLKKAQNGVIDVECDKPIPFDNTARKAAERFFDALGYGGVHIKILKGIPSEAGLGGASADAAGVLRGLERLYGKADEALIYSIGRTIGADVPFCLHGGCALAEGIGEKLTTLPAIRLPLLIVNGSRGVSTGALFRSLDLNKYGLQPVENRSGAMTKAIERGEIGAVASALTNALSAPAEQIAPEIAAYRARLIEAGASGALMTGSGSAVFGIFSSLDAARVALTQFSDCEFACVCETVDVPCVFI